MANLVALLPQTRRSNPAGNTGHTEAASYYVATHTWTSTPGAPPLSANEMYDALEEINHLYPQPPERRD